jgi:hypothetical protein
MAAQYFTNWLLQSTQNSVLCCRPAELITPDDETPNPEADSAIWRFVNGTRKTCSLTSLSQILSSAPYIIEVERILLVANLGTWRNARYFVPVAPDTGDYVEVHAKNAFGGQNPFKMTSTRYRNKKYICKEHQPGNGWGEANLTRIVWLISREGIGDSAPTREVNGHWVMCTLGDEWGCEV